MLKSFCLVLHFYIVMQRVFMLNVVAHLTVLHFMSNLTQKYQTVLCNINVTVFPHLLLIDTTITSLIFEGRNKE